MNSKTPTIALIGATGATGQCVLSDALARGYNVRALARTPAKLADFAAKITIIEGSVENKKALKELFRDVDVVISTLGTNKKPHYIVEKGVRSMLEVMEGMENPPRFFHMSAVGLGDSWQQCKRSWLWTFIVKVTFPLIGSELFADMERAEQRILATKNIDFVIVRAAILSNAQPKGYTVRQTSEKTGKMMVSRADIAAFMLDAVADKKYDGQAVSIFAA